MYCFLQSTLSYYCNTGWHPQTCLGVVLPVKPASSIFFLVSIVLQKPLGYPESIGREWPAPPIDLNGPKQPQVLFALFHLQSRYIVLPPPPSPHPENIQRPAADGVIRSKVNIRLHATGFFCPFFCFFEGKNGESKDFFEKFPFFSCHTYKCRIFYSYYNDNCRSNLL